MAHKRAHDGDEAAKKPTKRLHAMFGNALGFGINVTGQVGLGPDCTERKKPGHIKGELQGMEVSAIAAGGMHSVALTPDGDLYTWGCNDDKCLGRLCSDEDDYFVSAKAEVDAKFVAISAGDCHTAALSNDGKVYAAGCFRDSRGFYGFSDKLEYATEFVCIFPPADAKKPLTAVQISSGADHIAILTSEGYVYTVGTGEQGQLGRVAARSCARDSIRERHGTTTKSAEKRHTTNSALETFLIPQKVKGLRKKVKHVFCSAWTTLVIDVNDQIWGWGLNNFSQMGYPKSGNNDNMLYSAKRAKGWDDIVAKHGGIAEFAGGQHHNVALTKDGAVYTIGRGDMGQLGHGDKAELASAARVKALEGENIKHINAGSSVSFAINDDGKAFAWGFGENLQLSTGKDEDEPSPIEVTGKQLVDRKVLDITAGGQHSLVLASPLN